MPVFTVEFTSENRNCPRQEEVSGSNPAQVLRGILLQSGVVERLLDEYDQETDPTHSYKGWSHITISINCNREGIPEHERKNEVQGYEEDE